MHALTLDAALFPKNVFVRAVKLEDSDPVPSGIVIPAALASAVHKRRVEFAAGRWCAREALRVCAADLADSVIEIGAQREPCWPAGVVGSIAHTHGYAAAAIARSADVLGVGIDIERWMDEGAPSRIGSKIVHDDELPALVVQSGWSPAHVLTAVFSAKESLYKCLYPEVQRYFGFHDARVTHIARDGTLALHLTVTLTDALREGLAFELRFERRDDVVVTAMVRAAVR